jgi:subtilisin family serine protease
MSRRRFIQLLMAVVLSACFLVQPSALTAQSGYVVPNSFICQVDDSEDAFAIGQAAAQATGGTVGHVYTHALNGFSIQVPPGIVVANLRAHHGVINAEPDLVVHTCYTVPTGVDRIDAEGVLAEYPQIDCSGQGIAIIDTGIQRDHPDLNVMGGVRFYSRGFRTYQDDKFDDDNGHGTHVAGIAAAKGPGVIGVAPGARLYGVKVLGANGSGAMSDIVAGVDWLAKNAKDLRIGVANMSLGGQGTSDALHTAMSNCPVVFFVAAGNEHSDIAGFVPAAYGIDLPNVKTISAMADTDGKPGGFGTPTSYGNDDTFASFSNYSYDNGIALIMPGVNIYSTYLNSGHATMSGTSMASPHAAGLFALALAGGTSGTVAQDNAAGLVKPSGDPDGCPEPLGCANYPAQTPQPGSTLYVALDGTSKKTGKTWQATVTVSVVDLNGKAVSGAIVTGTWQTGKAASGTTVANGTCTLSIGSLTGADVTFTIASVTKTGCTPFTEPTAVTIQKP